MAMQNRRLLANRRNRELGNAPEHLSERELAAGAKPAAKKAAPKKADKRRRK